jgi:hypothetical protein
LYTLSKQITPHGKGKKDTKGEALFWDELLLSRGTTQFAAGWKTKNSRPNQGTGV